MVKLASDGALRAPSAISLRDAADQFLERAQSGAIRTRSGDAYKPGPLRGYEQAFRLRLLPPLGGAKLAEISRADVQRLVARWQEDGLSPSSIRNTINALRVLYRNADLLTSGDLGTNPTIGLRLPAVRGRRDRVAEPAEAQKLLKALPAGDRALWATALYAGLRMGELRALRWEHIDLASELIRVELSWDAKQGPVAPKSRAGVRNVPIAAMLREQLISHGLDTRRNGGLVFGRDEETPFNPSTVNLRARRAWEQAGCDPISLHECRHTCASYFIAAGANQKTVSTILGHANVATTLDLYGHLFPGSEAEAARLLNAYLDRSLASNP